MSTATGNAWLKESIQRAIADPSLNEQRARILNRLPYRIMNYFLQTDIPAHRAIGH